MAEKISFGPIEVDPTKRLLSLRGEPVEVQAKAFDLLLYLIEHRDRVVSTAELLDALWPGTAVTPGALSRAVHKARQAVGDDGDSQRVIATVHGRGFRFVAPLQETGAAPAADPLGDPGELARLERVLTQDARAQTRYAKTGGVHVAYRVFGDGPRDIVLIPGTVSHVELYWEFPTNAYLIKRLASFARVIVFDKRGQGLSDRVGQQTLEERTGDVLAVMDAIGCERATICGWSEGGAMSLMFAASHPERTSALVLFGSYASMRTAPWSLAPERFERFVSAVETQWGQGILVPFNAPSRVDDEAFVRWWAQLERASASPGSIVALIRANYDIDVRSVLHSIQVPTLILHREADALVPATCSHHLAQHIPGAKFVQLPGKDHLLQAYEKEVLDRLLDEIEEFVTGARAQSQPERVLATLLYIDARSRERRDVFHAAVRHELAAFRGREMRIDGESVLALFDGPARAIRCATAIGERARSLESEIRTAVHTGECDWVDGRVDGIAVQIAAAVSSQAGPGEVLVSSTVKDLVAGSQLRFADRGTHRLVGLPDEWRLYAVV